MFIKYLELYAIYLLVAYGICRTKMNHICYRIFQYVSFCRIYMQTREIVCSVSSKLPTIITCANVKYFVGVNQYHL